MTYPVLPPQPPAIVQLPVTAVNSAPPSATTETVIPTVSSSVSTSAALLGTPISVGYPVKQVEASSFGDGNATVSATPSSNQALTSNSPSNEKVIAKLKKVIAANTPPLEQIPEAAPSLNDGNRDIFVSQVVETPIPPLPTEPNTIPEQQNQQVGEPTPSLPTEPNTIPEQQNQQVGEPIPPLPTEPNTIPEQQNQQLGEPTPPPQTQPPSQTPGNQRRIIELNSDRQQFDQERQIVTAEGNVLLRFDGGVLDADRLQVNLENLIAVGEGNVAFTRGQQVIRGDRFTYNFLQETGSGVNSSGEINLPTTSSDFFFGTLPTDVAARAIVPRPLSDRVRANQPRQEVTNTGAIGITVGGGGLSLPQAGGTIRQVRFQAEEIEFYPRGWQARNVRLTNDPFSPPELELRADTVTLTQETPTRSRIKTTRQRLVFDQGFSLPIPRDQAVIDNQERNVSPGLAQIGFDGDERGGLFLERTFRPLDTEQVRVSVTPQFLVQKAVLDNGGNIFDPSVFGLKTRLNATLGERTTFRGSAVFTNLDFNKIEENLRGSLRLQSLIGGNTLPHTATVEYSYRDRLFNGSLGYQTVHSSIGGVISSPVIPVGETGINLSYQAGAQYISADTDREDLLEPVRDNDRVSLSRVQGSAALSRDFLLWRGDDLPATPTEGLRYTPAPVVPFLSLVTGVSGTSGYYSSGDSQTSITGSIGFQGQFGHFSRPFLDYTSFNLTYSQDIRSGLSPFLFDRAVDNKVLSAGVIQQLYGPFLVGVQTSFNLDTGESISTDLSLEYSRRSYGITLRYNPVLQLGSLSFRISDFNWTGGTEPFSDSEVRPVVGGVRRIND